MTVVIEYRDQAQSDAVAGNPRASGLFLGGGVLGRRSSFGDLACGIMEIRPFALLGILQHHAAVHAADADQTESSQ